MQESSFFLVIFLIAIAAGATFVAFRLIKSRWDHKNKKMCKPEITNRPTIEGIISQASLSDISSGLENTPPFVELGEVGNQFGTEQQQRFQDTIPSSVDISDSTLMGVQPEIEKEETEATKANTVEKSESNITMRNVCETFDNDTLMKVSSDHMISMKEKNDIEISPSVSETSESIETTIENKEAHKETTKLKGSFKGAPIGQRDKIPKESTRIEEAYKRLKPETVCWRREGKWIIGIEIPTEYFSEDIQEVRQGANKMLREESRHQCWRLESLTDPLEVTWGNENNRNIEQVLINTEPFGIFKLTGSDQAKGRLLKRISYGAYLLVVPSTWSFQNESKDQGIVEESISIEKLKAYYCRFEKGKDERFAFVDENGKLWPLEAKSPLFELVGTTLEDANDDMGLLFGNAPPGVRIKGHQSWEEIACVVLIQQGVETGKERFKEKIIPLADDTELSLGSNLQAQSSGWYSLRFYDNKQDSPIDTLDFRFVSTIDKIKIHQNSVLPEKSGHQEVTVELTHKPNCTIKPAAPTNSSIVVKQEMNQTVIVIPPKPEADESSWFLGFENGPCVHVIFLAERIWWSVGDEATEPMEWHDKSIAICREDFNPTANKALWIRLPKSGWTNRVYVHLSLSQPDWFPVRIDQSVIKVPLNNFYDSHALSDKAVRHDLLIQVQKKNQSLSAIVARLPEEKKKVEKSIQQLPQIINAQAACHGGEVFYGNCRNCRTMLKEKNYGHY